MMPRRELVALTTAWIVLGISFSTRYMFSGWFATPIAFLEVFLLTMLVIGTGFLGHELAHKFTAQRYGAWAEGDSTNRKANGIISLMGPLVNIAAAAIFGLAYTALSAAGIRAFVINDFNFLPWAIFINLWLGAFNMIPFFILDGQKVLTWNRAIWALVTIPLWLATAAALILQLS